MNPSPALYGDGDTHDFYSGTSPSQGISLSPDPVYIFHTMLVVISDLDGTLLDKTYSFAAAQSALELLDRKRIPLVLCTSKTRAEVEACRQMLDNRHPFIVENGGALYIPERYFGRTVNAPTQRDGYAVVEFGDPYPELVQTLALASAESGCGVRGFHQMSVEEVSARCNMTRTAAGFAKKREYDEPFEILSGESVRLEQAIERMNKRWTRGGTFYHILGANDKAHCVFLLLYFYASLFKHVVTVGLGDGLNDAGFLNLVDIPVLVNSPAALDLKKAVPGGRQSRAAGPEGWNQAIHEIIGQFPVVPGFPAGAGAGAKQWPSVPTYRLQ